jgi:adenosine deaminase
MNQINWKKWLHDVPKVELHLHLEGAIPLPTLWELIKKYGGDPEVSDIDGLIERFKYRDFSHFIRTWVWKNKFLREYDDFTFIAQAVAEDLKQQNIRYAEAFISPPDFVRHGLETGLIIESVRRGLNRVSGVKVNLVVDLVRDYGVILGSKTLDAVLEGRGQGIVGIGIGGSEKEFPPAIYKEIYKRAKSAGLKTSAHAGEAAGSESIWEALRELEVDRIGHGTRAIDDPKLVQYIIEKKIPLEMCPLSNLRTQVIDSIKSHPIRSFFDRGALVTVSTDDPKMFNNSLAEEFEQLVTEHHFSKNEIKQLTLNSVRASWLSQQEKDELHSTMIIDPAWTIS